MIYPKFIDLVSFIGMISPDGDTQFIYFQFY